MEEISNNLIWSKTKIQESFIRQNQPNYSRAYLDEQDDQYNQHSLQNQNVVQNFKHYVHNLDEKLSKANTNQLNQLKNKYRFYLAKVDKLEQIKNLLQHRFDSMDKLVQNSTVIEHERQSILWFTAMINETSKKLQKIQCNVNKGKQEKKNYYKRIQSLKQIIKREKDYFFNLKRTEMKIKNEKHVIEKASKLQSANSTFKNIVVNKLNKKNQKSQRLLQISSRISNCGIFNFNKQISSQSNQNEVLQLNRLPYLTNFHQNMLNDSFTNHFKRQSFDLQNKQIDNSNNLNNMGEIGKGKKGKKQFMHFSGICQDWKQNFYQNNRKKILKNSIKTTSEVIQNQVKNLNLLKEQLLGQVQKIQKGQQIEKRKLRSTKYFYERQKNMNECIQKQKQCKACVTNAYRNKLAIIKYSLHQQQISKILSVPANYTKNVNKSAQYVKTTNIMKQEEIDKDLLASQQELKRKKEYERQKEQFLTWNVRDIIKVVVEKDKIHEVLGLLQKYTFATHQNNTN